MGSLFRYRKPGGVSRGDGNITQDSADELLADPETTGDVIKMRGQKRVSSRGNLSAASPRKKPTYKVLPRSLNENLGRGLRHVSRAMRAWMRRADAYGEALNVAKRQNQELGAQNQNLTEKVRDLVGKLDEANKELDRALLERDEGRRIADAGTLADSTKATDDAIRSEWKLLAYNIRGLAHSLAKNPPSQQLDDVVTERLSFLEPSYHSLLQDQDYREPLVEGYLWCLISEAVLESGHPVWGGPGTVELKTLQDAIISQIGEPHHARNSYLYLQQAAKWLSQGSNILHQLWGTEPGAVAHLAHAETVHLSPFFRSPNGSRCIGYEMVWQEMKGIIESAVEIDRMMMRSKAIFQVHWSDDSQAPSRQPQFSPETMEAVYHESDLSIESKVKFFMSPVLHKLGNADGWNYDRRMVLCKASVVCN